MSEKEKILEELSFWKDLTETEKDTARQNSRIVKFKGGEMVHSCNYNCLGMIYVVSGKLRLYILSENGREITLFYVGSHEPCVLSASCVIRQITFDTLMTAEEETEVLVVGPAAFSSICDSNIYAKCFMYELATKRFSTVMWVMQQILFTAFDKRLAQFLYAEYEKNGSELSFTHEAIAKSMGSAREVVTRMMKQFSGDGMVELGRGRITVKNPEKLKKLALDK